MAKPFVATIDDLTPITGLSSSDKLIVQDVSETAVDGTKSVTMGALASYLGVTPGVKRYVASLTQSGEGEPVVANVLENTLGGVPVWSRLSAGIYRASSNGLFTAFKTIVSVSPNYIIDSGDELHARIQPLNNNTIELRTMIGLIEADWMAPYQAVLVSVKIEVYP